MTGKTMLGLTETRQITALCLFVVVACSGFAAGHRWKAITPDAPAPTQEADIPMCDVSTGPIAVPPHSGCDGVNEGPDVREGYLVDCNGNRLCKLPDGYGTGILVARLEPIGCASIRPIGETEVCAKDGAAQWKWIVLASERSDARVEVSFKKCRPSTDQICLPLQTGDTRMEQIVLAHGEEVRIMCSNQGWIEISRCVVLE